MTSPKTASEFVQVLEQASLIAPVHLQRIRNKIPAPNSPGFDSLSFAKALIKEGMLTPFQVKRLLAGRREGFFIGKYRLLDILGQGGMGRVYLAEQITMKRAVALKLIRFGDHESPAILVRFAREARAAAKLCHPNITQAYDFDQAGDYHYIAMEFIEGITLQDWVQKSGVVPWAQAAHYMAQAAAALEHAHQAGLVHRDVKPGNMMVDVGGSLKLLDLGLVNIPTEDDSLTLAQRDLILGTADYVAPEQAINSHNVDIRADLYSLGGVFYFLLTGRPPFTGKSAAQKIIAHQTEELRPLTEVAPEVPKRLADVVHKLLAKKPEERYQTPTELLQILKPFAQVAAKSGAPYDLSLVRFNREAVDRYLRFGVDAPPANNVPPPNFGQATMGDFRVPMEGLTPKPNGDLGSSVISKPVTPATPRSGTAIRKRPGGKSSDSDAGKSAITKGGGASPSRPTPIPPNKRPPSVPPAPPPPPKAVKRDKSWYLRLAVFVVAPSIAVLLLVWALLFRGSQTPPPQPQPNPTKQPEVAAQPAISIAANESAAALTDAFAKVAADGRITLDSRTASLAAGGLVIAGDKLPNRGHFTLASADKSRPVVLSGNGNSPILRISNVQECQLRDLIFDGRGSSGPLLEIEGKNPGVALQNVIFRNVTGIAVRLIDVQGQPQKPMSITNCSFDAGVNTMPIVIEARSFEGSARNIEIVGCTFAGADNGIVLAEPAENIAVRNCVFSQGLRGVRFAAAPILPDAAAIKPLGDWRTAGPFADKAIPKFDPQLPGDSQPLSWKPAKNAVLEFTRDAKGNGTMLACTTLRSPLAGPRRIFIGAESDTTLWVNGQKVFEHTDNQGYLPRAFTVVVNVHSGDNPVWLKTKSSRVAVEVAENYLPLSTADWRNVKLENNLFDGTMRAIEFAATPTQESIVRVFGNQFRLATLHPIALHRSAEPLRPGTIVTAENTDTPPPNRIAASTDFELLPVR